MAGVIGQTTIRLFVESAGFPKNEGLWGVYYYTRYRTPIPIEGERLSIGTIRLYEGVDNGDALPPRSRPRLDLEMSDPATVTGTWTSADGRRRLPVRLRRVQQPAGFEIAVRTPRLFANPRWPIELTYPAGWFLQVTSTMLTLRSPDPEDMLFDNLLECERGRGLPRVPVGDEAPELFQGGYVLTRDGWRVDSGLVSCDGRNCAPETRRIGSVLFMSAETGYRSRNPWGYAGIADANEYLVIDGNEWVHCFDRVLDSKDRIRIRSAAR